MVALIVGGIVLLFFALGWATSRPLTAADFLLVLGMGLVITGISELVERINR